MIRELTDSGSNTKRTYIERLDNSREFKNPHAINGLARQIGLDLNERYTNMSGMSGNFPAQECSGELRQQQASKWAFRWVDQFSKRVSLPNQLLPAQFGC